MAKEKAPNVVQSQFEAFKSLVSQKSIDNLAADHGITFGKPEKHVGFLSTGLLCFDLVLEGGYAPGRFSYLYGDTGAGKSTGMFFAIKESMPRGCYVVFFDEETAVDTEYCAKIGIAIGAVSGFRNKRGDWTECPQFVYRDNVTAEDTFKFMNQFMTKLLPDKVVLWDEEHDRHRAFLIPNGIKYRNDLHGLTSLVKTTAAATDESQRVVEVDDLGPQVVFLIDSLKAMPLEAKMDNLDAAELPALRARIFGMYMDTIKGPLGQKRCILLATNHMTTNPMAKFQCLQAETVVPLVDGRSLPIREVVENKVKGQVWSFDEETKKIVPADIVGWHFNGNVEKPEDFVMVTVDAVDTRNGVASFTSTRTHKVLTADHSWKQAQELTTNDRLVTKYESIINGTLKSFLLGTLVGDCTLAAKDGGVHGVRLQDNNNDEYLQWKLGKLGEFFAFKRVDAVRPCYASDTRHELSLWKRRLGKRDPSGIMDLLDDLSLAVWFMDDGHGQVDVKDDKNCSGSLSIKRLKGDQERLLKIQNGFASKGLTTTFNLREGTFYFPKASFSLLCERIAPYVPPCMQYKLPLRFRDRYEEFELSSETTIETEYVQVLSVVDGSRRKFRQKGKYDITVAKHQNYLVGNKDNGVIVHNSPEAEPGGKAVQFYPDSKLKLRTNRAKSSIEVEPSVDGGTDRYIPGVAEVFKNKWGAPFRTTDYRLMIDHNGEPGDGFDLAFDCFNFLTMTKNIEMIGTQKDKRYKILFDGFPESLSYLEFKIMFLTTPDGDRLTQQCRSIMESRKAFIQYAEYRQAEQGKPKDAKVSDPHEPKKKRSL